MTWTLAGADIRGYYTALGIQIPQWAGQEAHIRCFADPDAHQHDDRSPSMSVNLTHGAYHCHGCGATGGAYDAAVRLGLDERHAIDLMVYHGLTVRRPPHPSARRRTDHRPASSPPPRRPARPRTVTRRADGPAISQQHVTACHQALLGDHARLARLAEQRGWSTDAICQLQIGLERDQITIPVYERPHSNRLAAFLRYQPGQKMRAAAGSRRVLYPHPAAEPAQHILLVEGEPDLIAARSHHLPAIAIPGVNCWQPTWAALLTGRTITITLDSDPQGRQLARQIADRLAAIGTPATIVDLAPSRDDGYDLTDWLAEHPAAEMADRLGGPR